MPETTNLNLAITDDEKKLWKDWRKDINGVDNSNMKKIDDFAGKFVGGTTNQYFKKKSNDAFDGEWETADSSPTRGSNKLIESDAVYTAVDAVDNSSKITVATSGEILQVLSPDVFYNFTGVLTSLTLTLSVGIANRENEYKGQFLSGDTAPVVTFPDGVTWVGGTPNIVAYKTYQFSILNGIGVIVGV